MVNTNEGKFNLAVGAVIENKNTGKILLIKRSSNADFEPDVWENITGRVKQFEDPESALKREIKEETGLNAKIIKPLKVFHMFRGSKNAENELVGIIYWCETNSRKVFLSHEHSEFIWIEPEKALDFVKHKGIKDDIECFLREKGAVV
ncbi:MAG: NUDIX domain-containing protein [Candidatus Aenigmarchaeota archaeon]|nr:NUDIX domain-containing protein [Candidatus Aenigmarchaeota archaeon]